MFEDFILRFFWIISTKPSLTWGLGHSRIFDFYILLIYITNFLWKRFLWSSGSLNFKLRQYTADICVRSLSNMRHLFLPLQRRKKNNYFLLYLQHFFLNIDDGILAIFLIPDRKFYTHQIREFSQYHNFQFLYFYTILTS